MVKRVAPRSATSAQQSTLAAAQAASLTPRDARTLELLQLAALPLGQLVDKLLDTVRDGADDETGEVRQGVDDLIEQLNLGLEAKTQAYAHVAQRLAAEADAFETLQKHYADKAEARRSERKRLMRRLQGELERLGLHALKTPTVTAYMQNSPPAVELTVLTDEEVPDAYCERTPSMSKIAAALRNGVALSFATLRQSKHLRFR
jgi:ElaB/YqjD/DUF883 family membrane-anchored ribosome-binding protein